MSRLFQRERIILRVRRTRGLWWEEGKEEGRQQKETFNAAGWKGHSREMPPRDFHQGWPAWVTGAVALSTRGWSCHISGGWR